MVELILIPGGASNRGQRGTAKLSSIDGGRAPKGKELQHLLRPPTPLVTLKNLRVQYRHKLIEYGTNIAEVAFQDPDKKISMAFKRHVNPDSTTGGFVYQSGSSILLKRSEISRSYISPTAVVGPNCRVSINSRILDRAWVDGLEMFGHCLVEEDTIALFLANPGILREYCKMSGKGPNLRISRL